jgi:tetratricopeptide (TPR) repeat protein
VSRFSNLEMGGEFEDHFTPPPKTLVKDEVYYLAEAQSAFESGEFRQALRHFGKVLEYNANNPAAWTGQVRMLIELGEFREARLWADKAIERFPQEADLLAAKAVALGRDGDLDGALAFSDASIEGRGDTPYVWVARGDVLLARAESRADYCFEKARLLAPGNWLIAWLSGRVRYYHGQFALALKLLQQALEWNAGHFLLWLELGQCQRKLGLIGPARHSLTQAQQLNPQCREANLALIEVTQGGAMQTVSGWWKRIFQR